MADPLLRRRTMSRKIREEAAREQYLAPNPLHVNNGDEARYPRKFGSSTKGLAHDAITGEVFPAAYDAMIAALRSGEFNDFQALATNGHLGCAANPVMQRRFVNPQSAYAYDLEGIDSHQLTMRPAPAFASAEEAGEMVELYWMSLLRDVNFEDYPGHPIALAAAADLTALSDFRGPRDGGAVTPRTLFRDSYPGCTDGPYISQFLLQPINFGAQSIDTKILTNVPNVDFVTNFADWLNVINGCNPPLNPAIGGGGRVYCYNGRALSQYVHADVLFQAYLVACVNLLGGSYPGDAGNPYGQFIDHTGTGLPLPAGMSGSIADIGFGTFGAPWIATLVCEPATRALKHQWYQKWLVHRRLRPEEFGGHVEAQRLAVAGYPFHADLFGSAVLDGPGGIFATFGSHLLPQAFPEGSPVHTSYGSGHATVAGACVTMLKWFFDESAEIQNPMIPDPAAPDNLVPYVGPSLTVGGELNKLASNISQGRNIAGVHWRTDATEANKLGETIAISMLKELSGLYNEPFNGFSVTRFDGTTLSV